MAFRQKELQAVPRGVAAGRLHSGGRVRGLEHRGTDTVGNLDRGLGGAHASRAVVCQVKVSKCD